MAVMSAERSETEQAVRAPYFACEEQTRILQRYEEEEEKKS